MNQIFVYKFTAKAADWTVDQVKSKLKAYCKAWTFQLECSEGLPPYEHYQGHLSLKKKMRLPEVINLFETNWHFSPAHSRLDDYECKEQTRLDGPWKHDDPYIPRQVRDISELRPFQKTIVESAKEYDPRTINVIYDTVGNNGKSMLAMYVRCHRLGNKITYQNDFKDMMRMVCDLPTMPLYIIDIPRAIKKHEMHNFFAALEEIKNGYAWDDRYHFKEKTFDSPQLWVFMNTLPDVEYLSRDRWKVWQINERYELEPMSLKRKFEPFEPIEPMI